MENVIDRLDIYFADRTPVTEGNAVSYVAELISKVEELEMENEDLVDTVEDLKDRI